MAAHQAPLSLGFSRQEHWSGLPFPSPVHESESEVAQSCPTLSDPIDCSLPGCSVHGISQARVLEWGAMRTNPMEYQIVRTHTKETTWTQDHTTTSSTLCRTPHLNNKQKYKPYHQQTGLPPHSALTIRGKTNKETKISAQISPYTKLTQTTGPTLGGQKPKGRKNSILKPGKRRYQTQ